MQLAVIYKPPYSSTPPVTFAAFRSDLTEYLELIVICTEPIMLFQNHPQIYEKLIAR